LFPIEDCWFPPEEDDELSVSVARGTDFLTELDSSGDILVFLPGEQEIRDCAEYLSGRNYRNTEILPLFGRLSVSDQSKIFQRSSKRRIVLATNVAETSLTIPGIQYVVDSGLVRLSRFNPKSHIQELRLEMVSQASAKQRRGRCGRLMNGVCVHLYSEESFQDASPYTDPEILRSSLAGVILQMASLKLPAIQDFPFVDAPGLTLIKEGFQTLCDLQAIDKKQRLTKIGWELASYPIDPQLGRILLSAKRNKILSELIVIVSFLSIPDPRERPFEHAKEAETAQKQFLYEDSDFFTILNLWNAVHKELQTSNSALKRFCQKNYLNFRRIREWRNLKEDLQELYPDYPFCEIDTTDKIDYQSVHIALMSGLPRHLSCLKQGTKQYTDMTGRSCFIFPGSALTKRKGTPQWIMSFVWMETSKVFARCNAVIQPEWLETAAPHICTKSYDLMQWDEISGFVYAREKTHAGHLLIQPGRRCHYGAINPEKSREIFIREAFVSGCIRCPDIPWVQTYTKQFQQIKTLEFRMRKPDSIINSDALFEQFDLIFPEDFFSTAAIKQHWKQFHQEFIPDIRSYTLISPNNFNSKDFPDYLVFADVRFRLSYEYVPGEPNDGITLHARENDVNLLPRHVLEYIVPGYLSWKLDFCIRSMPKAIRKQLMPIEDCIHDFMEQYRACRINTEQPLMRAFSEFTENSYGVSVPDDVEQEDLPDYLRMKLAIHSQTDNTSVQIVYDMPKSNINNAKLSSEHVIAKQFEKWGLSDWPDSESLPDFLYLDKGKTKKGYPALVPDVKNRKIGIGVFLDFDTAVKSHCDGIYQLYRQKQSHFIKFLKGQFDKKNDIKLTFFHSNPNWLDELINLSIADSMDGDLWNIRSNGILEKKMEKSLSGLNDILSEKILFLEKLCKEAAQIHRKLRNLPEDSFSAEDMRNELDFLFRDGFLNFSEAFSQYGRYLKSLSVRLDRAVLSPQKDFDKSQWISAYIRKFQLVADMDRPLESMQELSQFFLLLEEARISAFTPELRTRVKVSPQILSDAWEKLKM